MGTPTDPHPGKATITLTGAPDSRELPMYGAKVLAVRQGLVSMTGVPKLPPFTVLNATASPGDKFVTVEGAVNWAAGDLVAIASSSYFAEHTDEALIVAIAPAAGGNTRIQLDRPLQWTHLGEVVPVPGDPLGRKVRRADSLAFVSKHPKLNHASNLVQTC